jgi:hypothetical protein
MNTTQVLAIAAVAFIGPLVGMSLDQSIKQLPARHRIGISAYSAYSRAADLQNGLFLYPFFGVGSALAVIAAAISGHLAGLPDRLQLPLDVSGIFGILHSLATARAAPVNLSQRRYSLNDEADLARVLDRFGRWNNIRAVLQATNFSAALWAVVLLAHHSA